MRLSHLSKLLHLSVIVHNFKNGGAAAYCMYVWQKEIKMNQ